MRFVLAKTVWNVRKAIEGGWFGRRVSTRAADLGTFSDIYGVYDNSTDMTRARRGRVTFRQYSEDQASCCSSLTSMPLARCPPIGAFVEHVPYFLTALFLTTPTGFDPLDAACAFFGLPRFPAVNAFELLACSIAFAHPRFVSFSSVDEPCASAASAMTSFFFGLPLFLGVSAVDSA